MTTIAPGTRVQTKYGKGTVIEFGKGITIVGYLVKLDHRAHKPEYNGSWVETQHVTPIKEDA